MTPFEFEQFHPENFPPGCWNDCPKDWEEIVVEAFKKLIAIYPQVQIVQYKEKFGGLRIYLNSVENEEVSKRLDEIILEAEMKVWDLESKNK